jgi:hypothetical protein
MIQKNYGNFGLPWYDNSASNILYDFSICWKFEILKINVFLKTTSEQNKNKLKFVYMT